MTITKTSPQQGAAKIIEAVPVITQFFRVTMRRHASSLPESLSVSQFRTLGFLERYPGASLSQLAEHLEVTKATASNLTERLVQKKLVTRNENPQERRQINLKLTEAGEYHLEQIKMLISTNISTILNELPQEQLETVVSGLTILSTAFAQAID
ncbi:MarR family transcriptional regulator [Calothrix sp. NIES-4071]|nr:MarR family transcriptional regulator [Calothrix sp. NIES-4071]BAZ54491.1 MarR family transcriptional regulator [Calothrix sp. NIES-4105]